jgi:hypothetical protein
MEVRETMSYVRMGIDSDVYMYGNCSGRVVCCGCKFAFYDKSLRRRAWERLIRFIGAWVDLASALIGVLTFGLYSPFWTLPYYMTGWVIHKRQDASFKDAKEAHRHLWKHKKRGHRVPAHAFVNIRHEIKLQEESR